METPELFLVILISIVILLIFLIIIIVWGRIDKSYLIGWWEAEPQYMEEAEVENMSIFIGSPKEDQHAFIMLINNDSDHSFATTANISQSITQGWTNQDCNFSIKIEDPKKLPQELNMMFDIKKQLLILTKDNKIHGVFYKNPYNTSLICTD